MINAVYFHKIARWLYTHHVPAIPSVIRVIMFLIYNSYIPYQAEIGTGTKFGYGAIGIVLHKRTKIGKNCTICQNVTIGGRSGLEEVPIIGDDVFIGAGAVVLGNIVIGNGVTIGANAVVIESIPSNVVVGGVPSRVLKYNS